MSKRQPKCCFVSLSLNHHTRSVCILGVGVDKKTVENNAEIRSLGDPCVVVDFYSDRNHIVNKITKWLIENGIAEQEAVRIIMKISEELLNMLKEVEEER